MPSLYDTDLFLSDIERMRGKSGRQAEVADVLMALVDEINENENAVWQLIKHVGQYSNPTFESKAIISFIKAGFNIYRIRPLFSIASSYRVLYAYDLENDDFYALGIIEKSSANLDSQGNIYDYQLDHAFTQGIFDEYDNLGIPRIP